MINLWKILHDYNIPAAALLAPLLTTSTILLIGWLLHILLKSLAHRWIPVLVEKTRSEYDNIFVRRGVFTRLAAVIPAIVVHGLAAAWMGSTTPMAAWGEVVQTFAYLWMLLVGVLTLHAVIDAVTDIYNTLHFARQLPIRSFAQVLKLISVLLVLLIAVAMLLGKSPALLLSGMGALTAVLMLVFKDPILGFVAGIQLAANKMLAVGDWLEMPKYGADGDVIDVSLTTVKVQNWDKTITTIPTYALIADSFKNWRGMSEAGGRRIKRNLYIDAQSVRFLSPDDIAQLSKAQLLTQYIQDKIADIERDNHEQNVDPSSPVNGRALTNIGTLRAYLTAYLRKHPRIRQDLTLMVRQLEPTKDGIPLQLYCFTNDTAWVNYEGIQSDIFDHILAIVPAFGLRLFQSPSGADLQALRRD
jgi:miniconductance mechanosensitive channel